MTLSADESLAATEKLETLRRLDQFRNWRSLDDKRYCLCCSKVIDGWQIAVVDGRLLCPTEGCESISMDWVLPTDEVLATMSILPNDASPASLPAMEKRPSKNPFKIRLRKLAGTLKRAGAGA